MELAREASAGLTVDLTILGIVALCVAAVAATAWWSAYCHRRLSRR